MSSANVNKRRFFSPVVILLGIALILYGIRNNCVVVYEKQAGVSQKGVFGLQGQKVSELTIILEATREGVIRLETGEIQSTRTGGETPAAFCPT